MSNVPAVLPGQPRDDNGIVFREPWEASAFAMAVALHQRGVFTWIEWGQTLAAQIATAHARGNSEPSGAYYHHWLTALEQLVVAKGASSVTELLRYQHGWGNAADRTRHGDPLDLQPEDFAQ